MLSVEEYLSADATALAGKVSGGEVSASELLQTAESLLERLNPRLNAVNFPMPKEAREHLKAGQAGPLSGVPILIKDAIQDYAGLPTSAGSRGMSRTVPQKHAAVTQRLLGSGAVIFGKTNSPELALKGVTDPEAFGVTNNPWDLGRSPGGSSGGSAAAVAAGLAPIAGANDGGGSIRIPASYCGLFGLRPSRGRVPPGPAVAEIWEGASSDHVLSRSVRDSALALDVLAGPLRGDPFIISPPEGSYRALAAQEPGPLKIGFSTRSPIDTDVHPEAVAAVRNAAELLSKLGHDVVEEAPDYDGAALARCFLEMYFGQVAATLAEARDAGARSADFELMTLMMEAIGKARSAGHYVRSHRRWNDFARALGAYHERFDLYMTPATATPAVRHEEVEMPAGQRRVSAFLTRTGILGAAARFGQMEGALDQLSMQALTLVPFTQLANLTGTPAVSVPLHWTPEGLPIGVQFIAAFGEEAKLLQLGAQLEQAAPWSARLKGLATGLLD